MKDFITSIASIMLFMIFVLQFVANQTTYTKLVAAESCVSLLCDAAEERGEIASEDINSFRQKAASFLDCAPEEIRVDTKSLESGNEGYDISVPLKNIIGAAKFLGISSADNEAKYHFRGVILTREEKEETGDNTEETTEEAENEEYVHDNGTDNHLLRSPEIPDRA